MLFQNKGLVALVATTTFGGMALAQANKSDYDREEYEANCAVCHGNEGKGNGPYMEFLRKNPTDLTTLAKRYGDALPVKRIYETIEGNTFPSMDYATCQFGEAPIVRNQGTG